MEIPERCMLPFSRAVKDSACEAGALSAQEQDRIWIIPDARNLSKYAHGKRADVRAELGIGEDVPLIGMIARIDPMKGQHIFLDAAALIADQIPSARFLLVGDCAFVSVLIEAMATGTPLVVPDVEGF
jgi:glycosyltransferase involved in cell wall biosynthesis